VLVAGDTKVRKAKRGEIVPRLNKERRHSLDNTNLIIIAAKSRVSP
jgi:hypothetical protein